MVNRALAYKWAAPFEILASNAVLSSDSQMLFMEKGNTKVIV